MGGSDDHDWSYYRGSYVPPRRRPERSVVRKADDNPLAAFGSKRVERAALIPASEAKVAIKRLLALEPDLQVEEIFQRLRFAVTVSKTTVSGIRTEFRHSLRVMREAGLLR